MANVTPGLWMLANSQFPFFGSNVAPAHSDPVKSPEYPFDAWYSGGNTTLFWANAKILPSGVSPWRNSRPLPSSHRTRPPRGLTHTLSGALSTSAGGDANTQGNVARPGAYANTCP